MNTIQIPAVVRSAFAFFDLVSQITQSDIPLSPEDVPERVGMIGANPRQFRPPCTPDEWEAAYRAARLDSHEAELLAYTRIAAECLDEGDDMTALDFITRALALAMHEFGDDAKRRASEIMDKIHHDIVRSCCLGQKNYAVAEVAEILSAIEYAQTEEERVAVRRYARAMAGPDECVIAMNIIKRKEAANA